MNTPDFKQLFNYIDFEQAVKLAVQTVKDAVVQYDINSNDVDQQVLQQRSHHYTSTEYLHQLFEQGDVAISEYKHLYNFKHLHVNDSIMPFVAQMYPDYIIKPSGFFVYPHNHGFMSWHTNSNAPGIRLYIAYVEQPDASFFRYYDNAMQQVITSYDVPGINAREFHVDADNLLWHCVFAKCNRYSFGFRILTPEQNLMQM